METYVDAEPTWWPEAAPDEIETGLWQGGTLDDETVWTGIPASMRLSGHPFDLVVTLYPDAMPVGLGVEEIRYAILDATLRPSDLPRLIAVARYAHAAWVAGRRVLIRCQAGVNRSALITALVLMFDGLDPHEAIAVIRDRRGDACLSNSSFEHWLRTQAAEAIALSG